MKPRALNIILLLAVVLVDCKHTPAIDSDDAEPVADCLSLLDTGESLTLDTPYVTTGPVVAVDGEAVPAASFRRFSTLFAEAKTTRKPSAVRRAYADYIIAQHLADEAGVQVTRGQVEQRYSSIESRFANPDTFEHFLADSGLSEAKLRSMICRDLKLADYVRATVPFEISREQVLRAHDEALLPNTANDRPGSEPREAVIQMVLEARAMRMEIRRTLSQPHVRERVEILDSQVHTSLTEDYASPTAHRFVNLSLERGVWSVVFDDVGSKLDEVGHDTLMVFRDAPMAVHISAAIPYVLYLSDDRVILTSSSERIVRDRITATGSGDGLELRSENRAGAFWLDPFGTLPLTYIDVMQREGVREPAVTPRGDALGESVIYACGESGRCIDARFEIDVLSDHEAQTFAIYTYPRIDGGEAYARHCAACHGDVGQGDERTHPPLVQTRWTTGELGDRALIESVVLGAGAETLTGDTEVLGRHYGSDLMPAFANHISPRVITEIINYVTRSWGNRGPRVSEQQVIDVYCDHGHDVVYPARVDPDEASRRVEAARESGDCGSAVRAELESIGEPVDQRVEQRAKLLYDANCAVCHGSTGRGDGPASPALQPPPTDFADPSRWKQGRDLGSAYLAIAEGVEDTTMKPYAERFSHAELRALAQMVVEWLPDDARESPAGDDGFLEYCRVETERRRLTWDRCEDR